MSPGATPIDASPLAGKGILRFSLAFCLLFFATGATQQYITAWFRHRGMVGAGFNVLLLLYIFYAVGSVLAVAAVRRIGEKRSMVWASLVYLGFCLAIASGYPILSYILAILSGLAAGLLWQSQYLVLNRDKDDARREANAGVFWTLYPLGSGVGSILFGYLLRWIDYQWTFGSFAAVALGAIYLFWTLRLPQAEAGADGEEHFLLPAFDRTSLLCVTVVLAQRGMFGLIISRVPLEVEGFLGATYVGLMCAPFFIVPMLLSRKVTGLLRSRGRLGMGALGCALSVLAPAAFWLGHSIWTVAAGILTATLGAVILNPLTNLIPGDIAEEKYRPRVSGLVSLASSLGILLGVAVGKLVAGRAGYAVVMVTILISSVIYLRTIRRGMAAVRTQVSAELGAEEA